MKASVLKGYLNGEEKLSVTDESPHPGGRGGVRSYTASFEADDLTVWAQ